MATLLLKFPSHLAGFLIWWVSLVPVRIFHWFEELITSFEANLQLLANLKLWLSLEPLFGDYGWKGRLVGFLLRGVRLVVTLVLYLAVVALAVGTILGWLAVLPLSLALIFGLI